MKNASILFILAGGPEKASSRVRGYWVAEQLKRMGREISLVNSKRKVDYLWISIQIAIHDIIIFQKVYSRYDPMLVQWAHALGKRVFFDIDDAPSRVCDRHASNRARKMMTMSDGVLAGSSALVRLARKVQPNTHLVPTGIRLESYHVSRPNPTGDKKQVCLGWIGNGAHYADDLIEILAPVLRDIAKRLSVPVRLRIVGACQEPRLYETFSKIERVEAELVDAINWSDPKAVSAEIATFDIGLYPLREGPFNEYKCGFKALEYMAMGLPVLASDLANHRDIVEDGITGFLLNGREDWNTALERLLFDAELRARLGEAGLKAVKTRFNTALVARQLIEIFDPR